MSYQPSAMSGDEGFYYGAPLAATLQQWQVTAVLRTVLRHAFSRTDHRRTASGPGISSTSTAPPRVDGAQRRVGFRVRSKRRRPETGRGALDASHPRAVFPRGAAQAATR